MGRVKSSKKRNKYIKIIHNKKFSVLRVFTGTLVGIPITLVVLYIGATIYFDLEKSTSSSTIYTEPSQPIYDPLPQSRPLLITSMIDANTYKYSVIDTSGKQFNISPDNDLLKHYIPLPNLSHSKLEDKIETEFRIEDVFFTLFHKETGNGLFYADVPHSDVWRYLYKYSASNNEITKLGKLSQLGICGGPIFWNEETHEIYSQTNKDIDSVFHSKELCVVDDRSGVIKQKLTLPKYFSIADLVFYSPSKIMLFSAYPSNSEIESTMKADFGTGVVKKFVIDGTSKLKLFRNTFKKNQVVLASESNKSFYLYSLDTMKVVQTITFPKSSVELNEYRVSTISPSYTYAVISAENTNFQSCFWMYNLKTQIMSKEYCSKYKYEGALGIIE